MESGEAHRQKAAGTQPSVGICGRTSGTVRRGAVMSDVEEPGSDKVTASTRAFEEIDAQVFAGPGRGATRSEAAASVRWGGPSPATVEAYRRMFDLVVKDRRPHRHG